MTDGIAIGGCACGSVRFSVKGRPLRSGLCHCLTCRKAHAAAFNAFLVFRSDQISLKGELQGWRSSPEYERLFCPRCGARVIGQGGGSGELEISLGSFDEPALFKPEYEVWITRREAWMPVLDLPQFEQDRLTD